MSKKLLISLGIGWIFAAIVETINMGIGQGLWIGMILTVLLFYGAFILCGYWYSTKSEEKPLRHFLIFGIIGFLRDKEALIKMEFMDNGIGVDDRRKKLIFQRGNREYKGTKGMGLGLSLVTKILESYNGEIWVEDKVKGDHSKGSNFVILVPEAV